MLTFFGEPSISSVAQTTKWSCSAHGPLQGGAELIRANLLHISHWGYCQVRAIVVSVRPKRCASSNAMERILATTAKEKLLEGKCGGTS